jgi:competence protein ComEC
MLDFRYYGPVEGRIVEIDRSQSDALRLTLDRVVLREVAPDRTPARVRVSLQGEQDWLQPTPGRW